MLPCKDIEFLGREINLVSLTSTVPAHLCQTPLPSHPFLLQPLLLHPVAFAHLFTRFRGVSGPCLPASCVCHLLVAVIPAQLPARW